MDIKRQLNECRAVSCRQSETCRDLEKELESTNTKLADAKSQITVIEDKMKLEREMLNNELEIKCQRLRTMQIEYDEAKQIIDEETSNVRKLETQVANLREVNEKHRREANAQTQRLKEENSAKDENALRMKSQISELARENECISSENCALKTQLQGKKCLLEKMKHAMEMLDQTKTAQIGQLEREKNALEYDVQQKKKKIEDLEQEMCSLRNKIKEIELNNGLQANEREMYCLRKKIKELETKFNCCPPVKRVSNCLRDKDCKERELNSCCSTNRNKCAAAPKTCDNGCVDNCGCILKDLNQMYCNLAQFKDAHMAKKS